MSELRALSLHRPWAWLILHAGKDIENRTWDTGYRGPLILHSARGANQWVLGKIEIDFGADAAREAARPGFIGIADLSSVHSARECGGQCSPWAEPSGMHWVMTSPRAFPAPLPGPGSRGLFIPAVDAATLRKLTMDELT